jgi:hypothetical protein
VQTAINHNAITEQPLGTPDDLSLIHAFCRPRTAKGPAHYPTPTGPA